jgi:hypothetical protein
MPELTAEMWISPFTLSGFVCESRRWVPDAHYNFRFGACPCARHLLDTYYLEDSACTTLS